VGAADAANLANEIGGRFPSNVGDKSVPEIFGEAIGGEVSFFGINNPGLGRMGSPKTIKLAASSS
jgi:hypothetical protein